MRFNLSLKKTSLLVGGLVLILLINLAIQPWNTKKPVITKGLLIKDLPINQYYVKSNKDYLIVYYTGDGGWKSFARMLRDFFTKEEKTPMIGLSSKKYFWDKKSPKQSADDLTRIIETFTEKWDKRQVVLIGYSFGADILPLLVNQLTKKTSQKIKVLILISPYQKARYEINLIDYVKTPTEGIAIKPVLDSLKKKNIQTEIICDESEKSLCQLLDTTKKPYKVLGGGHAFNKQEKKIQKTLRDFIQKHD